MHCLGPLAYPFARMRYAPRQSRFGLLGLVALASLLAAAPLPALTVAELLADPDLTPKRFAGHFENFTYEFIDYVQDPDVFLRTRTGD